MKQAPSEAALPRGFRFAATACGLKKTGALDLAVLSSDVSASAAAVFTQNLVVAAPVVLSKKHLELSGGRMRAVVVNAGNANCATGAPGEAASLRTVEETARRLGVEPKEVFVCSTGVIGVQLAVEKILRALPSLTRNRRPSARSFAELSLAICTTDTRPKTAAASFQMAGKRIHLVGCAKGAGMIHPNMATMLVYLFTDVAATPAELHRFLRGAADESFNNISIDGDTSTNDTVLLLAGGKSGIALKKVRKEFERALRNVCRSLAEQIVADGEGVTHVVRLKIEQARTGDEARRVAGAIANSPLVKTAWAGADPNWGRILAAIGYSGVKVNPSRINIFLGLQQICRDGAAWSFDKNAAHQYMTNASYEIRILLGAGKAKLDFLSCDLTAEYVHINADYST